MEEQRLTELLQEIRLLIIDTGDARLRQEADLRQRIGALADRMEAIEAALVELRGLVTVLGRQKAP